MAQKFQVRRDTAANWASSNPVLSQGEQGYVLDTGDRKYGDGVTAWNALQVWLPNTTKGASKLVSIADRGWGIAAGPANTVNTVGTSRITYTVGLATAGVTAKWAQRYSTGVDTPGAAGTITFKASLEIVSSTNPGTLNNVGTIYQFTFGGRTTATLDAGGEIIADLLGISLAPGDVVAIRTYLASGTAYTCAGHFIYSTNGQPGGFTAASDLTAPGSGAVTNANGYVYGPLALLGYPEGAATAKCPLFVGDSIGNGAVDTAYSTIPALGTGGFMIRAVTGKAGMVNVAIGGDIIGGFYQANGSLYRLAAARHCTSGIIEYGTNDFNGGSTAAAVESIVLTVGAEMRRLGLPKVFVCTVVPRVSSTDGFATTANQTPLNAGNEAQRVLYNTWVRAGCPIDPTTKAAVAVGTSGALLAGQYGHPITGYFDTAAKVESSLNSGKWLPALRMATGSMTSGSNVITSSDANFSSANQEVGGDKGQYFSITGAGPAGAILTNVAATITSSTQIACAANASTTVTNTALAMGLCTADGVHPTGRGHYLMSQAIDITQL